ncbi:MAG: radical SAM protein [Candidatus Micrarchaeota archaeon]
MTIFVSKPDAVKRGLVEPIRREIRRSGFVVLAERELKLQEHHVRKFYQNSFRRDYPGGELDERGRKTIDYMTSGPSHAYLVAHPSKGRPEILEMARKLRGDAWVPDRCALESIRYRFRDTQFDGYSPSFEDGFLSTPYPENVIHCVTDECELNITFGIYFQDLVRQARYEGHAPAYLQSGGSLDLVLCTTFGNSSSDKMEIKMHNGISHLLAYIRARGYRCALRAYAKEEPVDIAREISGLNPRAVGFSAVTSEFSKIAAVSEALRDISPEILQIGGGVHFSLNPHDIYATSMDYVVMGEGEFPLASILGGQDIRSIPGIAYRRQDGLAKNACQDFISDLGSLPIADHPDWDRYPSQRDFTHRRILLSRGCSFSCPYCCNGALAHLSDGDYVRFRPIESAEEEIKMILERYPLVRTIFLETECLRPEMIDMDALISLTDRYRDRVEFGTNLRIGAFNPKHLRQLKMGGFGFVNVGIESGSERVRREILGRRMTNPDIHRFVNAAHSAGLRVETYNMVGLPTETPEEFLMTIDLNKMLGVSEASIAIFHPYPGTALYLRCLSLGLLENPFFYHFFNEKERTASVLDMPQFAKEDILRFYRLFKSIFH